MSLSGYLFQPKSFHFEKYVYLQLVLKAKVHLFIIVSIECSVNGINSLRGLTYLYFQVISGWRRTADKLKGYLWLKFLDK